MKSFITSLQKHTNIISMLDHHRYERLTYYLEATELKTPPTNDSLMLSGTDLNPKCVSVSTLLARGVDVGVDGSR